MAELLLKTGAVALIDDADLSLLARHKWTTSTAGYPMRKTTVNGKLGVMILMHRVIMNAQPGQIVDHIDGNPLNNRRENLRFVTAIQNRMNCRKGPGTSSKFKGVCRVKNSNRWAVQLMIAGKYTWIGSFEDEHEAAHAYNKAAILHHGEFAVLNPVGRPTKAEGAQG